MDNIGCTHTRNSVKKITSKKSMTEILNKIDEKNYKKEGEIIPSRKNWEINICDGKIT